MDYFSIHLKVTEMSPEERLRWDLENDCTCKIVEGWWEPANHYGNCPMENPDAEIWWFYESIEEGFFIPKSRGRIEKQSECERVLSGQSQCENIFDCCDCGGNNCDCPYCWSCNACEVCKNK